MSTTTFFTFALHALVISGVGWLLVRWGLRDARHRAWAAMVMALSAVLQPLAVNLGSVSLPAEVSEMAPTDIAPAWKPEWTVKLSPSKPAPVMEELATEAPRFDWRDHLDDVLWLWLGGTLVLGLVHAAGSVRAWRWRKGLRRGARDGVWTFDGEGGPCVVGLWRPVIAVPQSADTTWSTDQWRWLMAHEGEHVRAHDPRMAWLLGWVRACLWWNPFIHALIGHWSQAREEVCDAVAVARTEDSEHYASFLVDIASRESRSFAIAMAASRPARRLRARLLAVLERRPVRARLGWGFRAMMGVIFATSTVLVSCVGVEGPKTIYITSKLTETKHPNDIQIATKFVEWKDFGSKVREQLKEGAHLNDVREEDIEQFESVTMTSKAGGLIEFIRVPGAEQLVTRVFKVAPDFLTRLAGNGNTAQQKLEALGFKFWKGSMAEFNPTTAQLIVKQSPGALRKIAALVDQVQQEPTQVYLQTKLFEAPELLGKDGAVMQEAEFQSLMNTARQRKGVDLLSAPSITTRLGQQATVEVSKERGQSDDFVGLRIDLNPKLDANGSLKLQSHVVIAHEFTKGALSLHALSKRGNEIDWAKVKRWEHKTTSTLKHHETAVIHLGETQKGRFVTVLITAKALLPTGQEAKEFANNPSPAQIVAPEGRTLQNKIAAVVNGRTITTSEVQDFIACETLRLRQKHAADPTKIKEAVAKLKAEATALLAARMTIMDDFYRRAKMTELESLIDQEVTALFGTNKNAAIAALAREGLTMKKFRWMMTTDIIAQALRDKQSGKTDSDAFKAIAWPTKNVYITAKLVDITSDDQDLWLNFAHDILLAEPAKPGDKRVELPKTEKSVPTPEASSATLNGTPLRVDPGIMALTGVFTDPQFQVIIRALSQKKGVSLLSMPSANVKSAQLASMKAGEVECEVTPVIGADGYSIDLLIQYNENPVKNAGANESPDISTIVTIWDGQTVALGGRISKDGEKPARHRLIFVTAKLIELSVEAAK